MDSDWKNYRLVSNSTTRNSTQVPLYFKIYFLFIFSLRDDYVTAIDGVKKLLAKRTSKNNLLFIGELLTGGKDFKPKMDHLTCYLPGTLALGVYYGMPKEHMELAEELLYTCYLTYAYQPTFLAPEITYFNIQDGSQTDMHVKTNDAHNLLRPEFVESLWTMYQITGNTTFQDWGWKIFEVALYILVAAITYLQMKF